MLCMRNIFKKQKCGNNDDIGRAPNVREKTVQVGVYGTAVYSSAFVKIFFAPSSA